MPNAQTILPNFKGVALNRGRFLMVEQIGSGAYGVVYRTIDRRTNPSNPKMYATKVISKRELRRRHLQSISREVDFQMLVCEHPNIVTVHDLYEDDEYFYIVLDYCPGDLFSAITEKHLYHRQDELVRSAFIQLIDALHWCHENSVFHRDLKPENILCSADGSQMYLADFGLCTTDRVSADFGCGSSFYMSPECIGTEYDSGVYSTRHSDIWSLGIILCNMVTGRNPWRLAVTKDQCYAAYLHQEDFLRQMLPVSVGASEILKRIFQVNPLSRITLPQLREEILKLDTFFMTDAELSTASDYARHAAKSYAIQVSISKFEGPRAFEDDEDDDDRSTSSTLDVDEEVYVFPTPRAFGNTSPQRALSLDPARPSVRLVAVNATFANFTIGTDTESDSSSSEESEGPITPETHPINPQMEVPDIPEEGILDESIGFTSPKVPQSPGTKHMPAAVHTAAQRFLII